MDNGTKIAFTILGLILCLAFGPLLFSAIFVTDPKIIDFRPSLFEEKAESPFFYSLGNELKYGDRLDPSAKTLLHGKIEWVVVGPDNKSAAVIADGRLRIISADGSVKHDVTAVKSVFGDYRKPKPIGERFFRDRGFQWSRDSRYLYLVKDEYYEEIRSELYSEKGELWRYDLETKELSKVLEPFPAHTVFLGVEGRIYFSAPNDQGDLVLRYFDGVEARAINPQNGKDLDIVVLRSDLVENPFYTFTNSETEHYLSHKKDVQVSSKKGIQQLRIRGSAFVEVTWGDNLKGKFSGSYLDSTQFLPGDRYFLFSVHAGNHRGQLLIDTNTGHYKKMPKETRVYLKANTDVYTDYCVTTRGISLSAHNGGC